MLKSKKRGNPVSNETSVTGSPTGECDGLHWLDLKWIGKGESVVSWPHALSCQQSCDCSTCVWGTVTWTNEKTQITNHLRCVTIPSHICNTFCRCNSHLHTNSIGRILFTQYSPWKHLWAEVLSSVEPLFPEMVELNAEDETDCSTSRSFEQSHGVSGWKDQNLPYLCLFLKI